MKASLVSLALLVVFSAEALGLSMEIMSPEIGHPPGISKIQLEKVKGLHAFMDEELTFIEGRFINEFSTQRFGGSSALASQFIALLAETEIWEIKIQFHDFGEQQTAFTFSSSSSDSVSVTLNSGRDDFLLKDFSVYLSPIKITRRVGSRTTRAGPGKSSPETKPKSEEHSEFHVPGLDRLP